MNPAKDSNATFECYWFHCDIYVGTLNIQPNPSLESIKVLSSCQQLPKVLYMWSSFWLLEVESHDFSHSEKERPACKALQIQKMTTIFTQNDNLGPFWMIFFLLCSSLEAVLSFFLNMRKITWPNSQEPKTREHVEDQRYLDACLPKMTTNAHLGPAPLEPRR